MVFVWSQLVRGDANYTLVQVSINDIIIVFAFAPLAALLLGLADIIVSWETLLLSVLLYVIRYWATRRISSRIPAIFSS
jgi:ACR3 family arsenite transporter